MPQKLYIFGIVDGVATHFYLQGVNPQSTQEEIEIARSKKAQDVRREYKRRLDVLYANVVRSEQA